VCGLWCVYRGTVVIAKITKYSEKSGPVPRASACVGQVSAQMSKKSRPRAPCIVSMCGHNKSRIALESYGFIGLKFIYRLCVCLCAVGPGERRAKLQSCRTHERRFPTRQAHHHNTAVAGALALALITHVSRATKLVAAREGEVGGSPESTAKRTFLKESRWRMNDQHAQLRTRAHGGSRSCSSVPHAHRLSMRPTSA
jgi:hypothetical protein